MLLLVGLPLLPASAVSPNDDVIKTRVISVYDGDTFTVQIDGEEEKVRLLGVDTPELKANGTKTTCGGDKAKALTSALVLNKEVALVRDPQNDNRDAFGRLLRTTKLNGRLDIGILLLITGNAAVYERAEFAAKPLYLKLQKRAQAAKRGIWGECGGLLLAPEASPTATPKATVTPTPTPTPRPTATPKPKVTPIVLPDEEKPSYRDYRQPDDSASTYSCGGSVTCSRVSSCAEARYYLNSCGQKSLDRDGGGIPCEELCK